MVYFICDSMKILKETNVVNIISLTNKKPPVGVGCPTSGIRFPEQLVAVHVEVVLCSVAVIYLKYLS